MTGATHEPWTFTRHRFTADQFQRMVEVGILPEGTRVELIRGEILMMEALGARDVACISQTLAVLGRQVPDNAIVLPHCSIRVADDSEPQPDVTVAASTYDRSALSTPKDVYLVVEVSDSSLAFDRTVKLPMYGATGIPESWIFDLTNNRIERHTEPHDTGYATIAMAGPGGHLASTTLSNIAFDVDEVLGLSPKR